MSSTQDASSNLQAETFRALMAQEVEAKELAEQLISHGLRPSYGNAVCLSALRKAASGDLTAYRLIRDVLEEHPEAADTPQILSAELGKLTDEELERLADRL